MLDFINLGDSYSKDVRLVVDLDVKVFSKNNLIWLFGVSVPILIIIGVGFPLFLMIHLIYLKRTNKLYNSKYKFMYGYIFFAYKERFCYWDIIILMKKIILSIITIVFAKQI